jgi:hypothetical protein
MDADSDGRAERRGETAVIVCSRNRGERLERTLSALHEQSYPADRFEIVVVDDASEDDARERVKALSGTMPNLKLVALPERRGTAGARNAGVESCSAKYLLFTDDDCVPARDWVARTRAALESEGIVAGAVGSFPGGYFALCHDVAQFYGFMPCRESGRVELIAGANMGIRREVLDRVGGFRQPTPHAEDIDFILRAREAGYSPWFAADAVVLHDHRRTTLGELIHYAADHAESTILLRRRHAELLKTPFVLRSPTLLIAAAPLIALKVSAGIFLNGNGMSRLWRTAPVVYLTKLAWCIGAARALRRQGEATPAS